MTSFQIKRRMLFKKKKMTIFQKLINSLAKQFNRFLFLHKADLVALPRSIFIVCNKLLTSVKSTWIGDFYSKSSTITNLEIFFFKLITRNYTGISVWYSFKKDSISSYYRDKEWKLWCQKRISREIRLCAIPIVLFIIGL